MSGADPRVRAVLKLAPVIPVFTPENIDDAVEVARALFNGRGNGRQRRKQGCSCGIPSWLTHGQAQRPCQVTSV